MDFPYEISFHSNVNKTNFHMKSFMRSLAFIMSFKATKNALLLWNAFKRSSALFPMLVMLVIRWIDKFHFALVTFSWISNETNMVFQSSTGEKPFHALSSDSNQREIYANSITSWSKIQIMIQKGKNHQRWNVLMFKQILLTSSIRNVWRTVTRMCMLTRRFPWFRLNFCRSLGSDFPPQEESLWSGGPWRCVWGGRGVDERRLISRTAAGNQAYPCTYLSLIGNWWRYSVQKETFIIVS